MGSIKKPDVYNRSVIFFKNIIQSIKLRTLVLKSIFFIFDGRLIEHLYLQDDFQQKLI